MTARITIAQKSRTFFGGVLRTSRGSVALVAVENMPSAPTGALTVATGVAYGHSANPEASINPTCR